MYVLVGSETNRLYQLTSDWNGDGGASIFDFSTFAYWFGQPVGVAPVYVDLNNDGGVSIFDFSGFANRFGQGVLFPVPLVDNDNRFGLQAFSKSREASEQLNGLQMPLKNSVLVASQGLPFHQLDSPR